MLAKSCMYLVAIIAVFFASLPYLGASNSLQDNDAILLLTKGIEVLLFNTSSHNIIHLFSSFRRIKALDFYLPKNPEKPIIFFADSHASVIFKASPSHDVSGKWSISSVISTNVGQVESISVDWINKRLYWLDSKLKLISSADFNGHLVASISSIVHQPISIHVDPLNRFIFSHERTKTGNIIKRSSLSGRDSKTIIESHNIRLIDIDIKRKLLFILSQNNNLNSSHFDGTFDNSIPLNFDETLSSLIVNNQTIFAASSSDIITIESQNVSDVFLFQDQSYQVNLVDVFLSSSQPSANYANRCVSKNAMCTHICSSDSHGKVECSCPNGLYLSRGNRRCQTAEDTLHLVDMKSKLIRSVSPLNPAENVYPPVALPNLATDYIIDTFNGSIYWTSFHMKELQVTENFTTSQTLISWGSIRPTSIAIDKSSGNIYVSSLNAETGHNTRHAAISVCSSIGSSFMHITTEDLSHPKLLTLDAVRGRMYFVDVTHWINFIVSSFMDGKDRQVFHKTSAQINEMTVDENNGRLFWTETSSLGIGMTSTLKSRTKSGSIIVHKTIRSGFQSIISTSSRLFAFIDDSSYFTLNLPFVNGSSGGINNDLSTSVTFAIHNSTKLSSSCSKAECLTICLPRGSAEFSCPPISGMDEFLFYTKHSRVSSIVGFKFSDSKASSSSAFPVQLTASWVTHSAYYYKTDSIFWVDSVSGSIKSSRRDGTNVRTLKSNLKDVNGLAIDWIAENVYWSESSRSTIGVMKLDGSFPHVVVYDTFNHPSQLAVDPILGYLYWIEGDKKSSRIKQSTLAGNNIQTVVDTPNEIRSVQIDPFTSNLYWISSSASDVNMLKPNGSTYTVLSLEKSRYAPSSLAFDQNFIYWIDLKHKDGSLLRVSKTPESSKEAEGYGSSSGVFQADESVDNGVIQVLAYDLGKSLTSINFFSSSNQVGKNPCLDNNGGCNQLCLFEGNNTVSCHCTFSIFLPNDQNCSDDDDYLFYARGDKIFGLRTADSKDANLPTEAFSIGANNMASHAPNNLLYSHDFGGMVFTDDLHKSSIYLYLNKTVSKLADVGVLQGLYYSSHLHVLIWSQTSPSAIGQIHYDANGIEQTKSIHVTKIPKQDPSSIVMDDCAKVIYWVCSSTSGDHVHRTALYDSTQEHFYKSKMKINALAIDNVKRVLYWTESEVSVPRRLKITRYNLDTLELDVIYSGAGFEPQSLVCTDDNLFWSDWYNNSIIKFDLTNNTLTRVAINLRKVQSLGLVTKMTASNCSLNNQNVDDKDDVGSSNNGGRSNHDINKEKNVRSSLNFDLLLISLPVIMLATIFFSLLIILIIRKYACCKSGKARISYLSYNESLPRGLCCSARNVNVDPTDQQSNCFYHMEMENVNLQFDHNDKDFLIES